MTPLPRNFPSFTSSMILEFLALIGTCVLAYIISERVRASTSLPLPPGPPADKYGPVFSLRQGIPGLGEKRTIIVGETLSGNLRILLIRSGKRFKKLRKALQLRLQPKIVVSYHPVQTQTAGQHMLDIIDEHNTKSSETRSFTSSRHQDHARRYAAAVVMALVYGKVPLSYEDPAIQALNCCLTHIGNNRHPGAWKIGHKEKLGLFKGQLQGVRERMGREEEVPACFGKYLIEQPPSLGLSDDEIAYLAGSIVWRSSRQYRTIALIFNI
ncbi:hypothetical protein BT96DRAFT_1005299 [Gymnopus androsaceus JB14]|uniref:Uncharacterized protein n=1 Tax=Gymnopus androsaceus JB14 TaxID=1447944 RepID=A0A6A4GP62_9AGAR|nr:hypothetical protein BT96DRAFT_1005299 [Gymnopus androsaceus JB14]